MNYWKKKKLYMFAELGLTQKPFFPPNARKLGTLGDGGGVQV